MAMPWQLERGLVGRSPRRRGEPKTKIVELLPHINVNELVGTFPTDWHTIHYLDDIGFRWPRLRHLEVSRAEITAELLSGIKQPVRVKWIKTGLGKPRPSIVCVCGRCTMRLFINAGHLACRWCHGAVYASQTQGRSGRKHMQAAKLRVRLNGMAVIGLKLPHKPKWMYRRTYARLLGKAHGLEHSLRSQHWRSKQLDGRISAYYV